MIFLEPSTRTKLSFEFAAARAGLQVLNLGDEKQSSRAKGETWEDSIFTLAAMRPKAIVVRAGDELPMTDVALAIEKKFDVPLINAGWGTKSHPTQALLDFYTIQKALKRLANFKFLFVGDIKHSRVFSSHLELARKLSVQIGVCSPAGFAAEIPGSQVFQDLDEALRWADVAMFLRYQRERHSGSSSSLPSDIHESHGLNRARLATAENLKVILHPGPFERGVEIASDVFEDRRCQIWNQVQNGVLIREALLRITSGVGM